MLHCERDHYYAVLPNSEFERTSSARLLRGIILWFEVSSNQ